MEGRMLDQLLQHGHPHAGDAHQKKRSLHKFRLPYPAIQVFRCGKPPLRKLCRLAPLLSRFPGRVEDHLAPEIHRIAREVERIHRNMREQDKILVRVEILPHFPHDRTKVLDVGSFADKDDTFCQGKLRQAKEAEGGLERFLAVPLVDGDNEEIVEAGFIVCPEIGDLRVDEPGKRAENLLRRIAEEFVFHRGDSDDGRGIDRIMPMGHCADMEDRKLRSRGVVAEVIAERSLPPPLTGRHDPFEDEFRIRGNRDGNRDPPDKFRSTPPEESGKHRLVDILGKRGNGRHQERGIGAESHRQFQRAAEFFGLIVVKPAPFLDLPVHARGFLVKHLHPVHPHVPFPIPGIVRHDLRQREKPPPIPRPASENRKGVEIGLFVNLLREAG